MPARGAGKACIRANASVAVFRESEEDAHHLPGRVLLNTPLDDVVSLAPALKLLEDLIQGIGIDVDRHAGVGELGQSQEFCCRHARYSLRLVGPKSRLTDNTRHTFLETGRDVHEDGLRQATVYQSVRFDGFSKHVVIPPEALILMCVQ